MPFEFFQSMLGISVDVHEFEFDETNGDEKDKVSFDALCEKFWSIKDVWNRGNTLKIILRFLQLAFSAGVICLVYSRMQTYADFDTSVGIFDAIMYFVSHGSVVVIVLELLGCRKIAVRPRAKIPHMRRNVNASYLRNRPNNRYGLIPYVGPILSALASFMNQPSL